MARIEARQPVMMQQQSGYDDYDYDYPEVEAGREYTNYYGDPQHGTWDNGNYRFNNPHGQYASSTNSFLVGVGVGGLLGYMGTKASMRSNWDKANPNGYKTKRNSISKKDLAKRKEQSRKDKAKYRKQKSKKQAQLQKKNINKKIKASKKKKVKINNVAKKQKRKVKQKKLKKKQFAKKSTFNKSKRKTKKRK